MSYNNRKYQNTLYNDSLHTKIIKIAGRCLNCGVQLAYTQGKKRTRRNLSIHHLDGCKNNNSLNNITVLCNSCHNNIAHIRVYHMTNNRSHIKTVKLNTKFKSKAVIDFEEFNRKTKIVL